MWYMRRIPIKAVQWKGESPLPDGCRYGAGECFDLARCYFTADETGRLVEVNVGDWILTEAHGERRVINPTVFASTYIPEGEGEDS